MNLGQKIVDGIAIKLDKSSAKGQSKDKKGRFSGGTGAPGGAAQPTQKTFPGWEAVPGVQGYIHHEANSRGLVQQSQIRASSGETKTWRASVTAKGLMGRPSREIHESFHATPGQGVKAAERVMRRHEENTALIAPVKRAL